MKPANVDAYLEDGCGRCQFGGTPQCKVHRWTEPLQRLRAILHDCRLTEEIKWSIPCYTYQGKNILILAAFREYCAISFFKGSLLQDKHRILERQGENSQSARIMRFYGTEELSKVEEWIRDYIFEAIEVEMSGLKPDVKKVDLSIPDELQQRFSDMPDLQSAFEALTPGRQKAYIMFFSAPKQLATRYARIDKLIPKIFQGKGPQEY
ncbi:MAG: hypothetical protein GC180_00395 [Bacteroidetes bacterium]|nr:hypothetical protein [Bacteroidota bacterium]